MFHVKHKEKKMYRKFDATLEQTYKALHSLRYDEKTDRVMFRRKKQNHTMNGQHSTLSGLYVCEQCEAWKQADHFFID